MLSSSIGPDNQLAWKPLGIVISWLFQVSTNNESFLVAQNPENDASVDMVTVGQTFPIDQHGNQTPRNWLERKMAKASDRNLSKKSWNLFDKDYSIGKSARISRMAGNI